MINSFLTEHIHIWTTAQELKTSNRGLSAGNQSLLGIKKLRELILELAVRGKLVPQDPDDEPASVLLKKIEEEKKRLIKEGKIKKTKLLPKITSDEIPFMLPKGWIFERLNEIGEWGAGATPNRSKQEYYGGEISWFKSGELIGDYISKSEEFVTELALKETSLRYNKIGDVLIAMYGATIGKTSILEVPATTNQAVCACTPFKGIYNIYLLSLLKAYKSRFIGMGAGGAQPNISKEKIIATVIGLPPLTEQYRIVAKVDELMALCDELEKQQTASNTLHETLVANLLGSLTDAGNSASFDEAWQRIENNFDTLFTTEHSIDKLKQTILQLAVMGKLVPQDPNDEPAGELLKKIAKEKTRLIKEGKIKKQVPLPEITEVEKPFELPKSWVWTRLGSVLKKITDGTHFSPPNGEIGEYLYISAKNIKPEGVLLSNATYITKDIHDEIYSRCDPEHGDILYIKDGATTGITTINNLKVPFSMLSSVALLKVPKGILNTYLLLSLTSPYFYKEMRSEMTGVAITRVTLNKLNYAIITLPPLTEQHRIVSKVDELFAICDELKERIGLARATQNLLAGVVVEQALKSV